MQIKKLQLVEGARRATGLAVVFDVFRASSHIVTMFSRGADRVIPVATVAKAREVKAAHPDYVLAGERGGIPPEGFDLGNSPTETASIDLTRRTVVLTTSAGSRGFVAAWEKASEVICGSFLNAHAVKSYIDGARPAQVSLLALGTAGEIPSPEDDLAAAYVEALIEGRRFDLEAAWETIRSHPQGEKFLDPTNTNYPTADLEYCLRTEVCDLVPRLVSSPDGQLPFLAVEPHE